MTRQVLIFLHMDDEHPGYIADYLYKKGFPTVLFAATKVRLYLSWTRVCGASLYGWSNERQ